MILLDNKELALRWNEISPKVQEALDHGIGECSAHDLFIECMSSNAQCWEHEGCIGITRFNHFPQYKQLQIVTVTGNDFIRKFPKLLEMIEDFAKETGCRNVSIWGRPGWRRLLQEYSDPYTVLIKVL